MKMTKPEFKSLSKSLHAQEDTGKLTDTQSKLASAIGFSCTNEAMAKLPSYSGKVKKGDCFFDVLPPDNNDFHLSHNLYEKSKDLSKPDPYHFMEELLCIEAILDGESPHSNLVSFVQGNEEYLIVGMSTDEHGICTIDLFSVAKALNLFCELKWAFTSKNQFEGDFPKQVKLRVDHKYFIDFELQSNPHFKRWTSPFLQSISYSCVHQALARQLVLSSNFNALTYKDLLEVDVDGNQPVFLVNALDLQPNKWRKDTFEVSSINISEGIPVLTSYLRPYHEFIEWNKAAQVQANCLPTTLLTWGVLKESIKTLPKHLLSEPVRVEKFDKDELLSTALIPLGMLTSLDEENLVNLKLGLIK